MRGETFLIEEEEESKGFGIPSWAWLTLIAAAWLVFQLTAEPVLVVLAACGKVGWKDVWVAFWLRKRDPDWIRGRTIRWFYFAHGSWKITVTAFCTFLLMLPLVGARQPNQKIDAIALSLSASIGLCMLFFVVSSATTALATWLAWFREIRIWVDTTVDDSRRRDIWPPEPYGQNRLGRLLTTAAIFFVIVVGIGAIVGMSAAFGRVNPGAVGLGFVIITVISAAVILVFRERLLKTIAAKHPRQCWDLVELEIVDPRAERSIFLPITNEDSHAGF